MTPPAADPTRQERRAEARRDREEVEAAERGRAVRRRRLGVLGAVVGLAALVGVLLVVLGGSDPKPKAGAGEPLAGETATRTLLAGIPQDGRFLGSPDAPLTLVEFADLQCPFCAEFARNALPTIIRDYVRPGKVRLEFRPRAFLGPDSITGAQVVVAAGRQDKAWNVLDLLYANQGGENTGWLTDDLTRRVLVASGVDPVQNRRGANSAAVATEIQQAEELAVRNGLEGTPAFLVGRRDGTFVPLRVRALTGEIFSAALDEAAR